MEFMITRASDWANVKPCDEAYEKNYMRKDVRTLKSFEEYDNRSEEHTSELQSQHLSRMPSSA